MARNLPIVATIGRAIRTSLPRKQVPLLRVSCEDLLALRQVVVKPQRQHLIVAGLWECPKQRCVVYCICSRHKQSVGRCRLSSLIGTVVVCAVFEDRPSNISPELVARKRGLAGSLCCIGQFLKLVLAIKRLVAEVFENLAMDPIRSTFSYN